MSELGADATRGVPWPWNGLTEIPFRLYTDPDQYRLEQERIFKGPTWSFLCLAAEIPTPSSSTSSTTAPSSTNGNAFSDDRGGKKNNVPAAQVRKQFGRYMQDILAEKRTAPSLVKVK